MEKDLFKRAKVLFICDAEAIMTGCSS